MRELKGKKIKMQSLAAIILAAGRGKRLNSKEVNKVVLPLGNKPMITYTIDLLEGLGIEQIIVVIGFAKRSVMEVLKNRVIFVEQRKRLGTAHAVFCAFKYLPKDISDVLVLNGDDSAFFNKKTIEKLVKTHQVSKSPVTFLTIDIDNPSGLGRIIRDEKGRLVGVIEDKDLDAKDSREKFKKIKEVNPACYVFGVEFLRDYLKKVKKSRITGEYYLTELIDLALKNSLKVETVKADNLSWRGVNTEKELREAERIFLQTN